MMDHRTMGFNPISTPGNPFHYRFQLDGFPLNPQVLSRAPLLLRIPSHAAAGPVFSSKLPSTSSLIRSKLMFQTLGTVRDLSKIYPKSSLHALHVGLLHLVEVGGFTEFGRGRKMVTSVASKLPTLLPVQPEEFARTVMTSDPTGRNVVEWRNYYVGVRTVE